MMSYLSIQLPCLSLFSANTILLDCFLLGRAAKLLIDTSRSCMQVGEKSIMFTCDQGRLLKSLVSYGGNVKLPCL